MKRKR
jgi:hypothetical protein